MPLPTKVQSAVAALESCGIDERQVAPPFYRWYVRYEKGTPPPLWDANAGYWVGYGVYMSVLFGGLMTAFAVLFVAVSIDPPMRAAAKQTFLVSQFAGWALAGFVGWLSAMESRRLMRLERESLGLPAWNAMHAQWRPSVSHLQTRAAPGRYWLRALWGSQLFSILEWIGFLGFALVCWQLPAKAAALGTVLAMLYVFVCAFGVQRTLRGATLAKDAHLWRAINGLAIGALSAAFAWNLVAVEILDLPREPALTGFVLAAIGLHLWEHLTYEQHQVNAARAHAVDQARLLAEARLHALKAQIEPHFIFNTLAHLDALIASDPAAARTMTAELSDFLRASLDVLRREDATLGDELKLVRAYLGIARLRMGGRLATEVRADPELDRARLPSHLLLTLVENAIQHGIDPKPGPGRVEVRVARATRGGSERAVLSVIDDGAGFGQAPLSGSGLGLANVRERLASAFGADASLQLKQNQPHGVIAELDIPFQSATTIEPTT